MIGKVVSSLSVLILAVVVGLLIHTYPIDLFFVYGGTVWKFSFWLFLGGVFLLYWFLKLLESFLGIFTASFDHIRKWWDKRKNLIFYRELEKGLLEYLEGNFSEAEKVFLRLKVPVGAEKLRGYLLSKAYMKLGNYSRALESLQSYKFNSIETEIRTAQLWIDAREYLRAEALLLILYKKHPRYKDVLHGLSVVWQKLGRWEELSELLPKLYRTKVFNQEDLSSLEDDIYQHLLIERGEEIKQYWRSLPRYLRKKVTLVNFYVKKLMDKGEYQEAEQLLVKILSNDLDPSSLDLYTKLKSSDLSKWLSRAETWLERKPKDASLLYYLGKIFFNQGFYEKAKTYLKESVAVYPTLKTYIALAELAVREQNVEEISIIFQQLKEFITNS